MTREAVDRRLGTLVAPHGAGWKARYTIGHAPEGSPRDFVRLELFGPDGALQLQRDLPLDASCSTMADVIALVLDRHFRGLPEHEPEPPPVAVETAAQMPVREKPTAPAPAPGVAAPPLLLVGVELSVKYPLAPGAGLRWLGELGEGFYWGVAVSSEFVPNEERLERGGSVEHMGVSFQAHAGFGPNIGPVRTHFGPVVRFTLDRGSARDLAEVDTRYRAVCAGGALAGAVGPVSDRLFWMLTGAVDWTIGALTGQFAVDGREVLRPSGVQAWTAVGIGYSL